MLIRLSDALAGVVARAAPALVAVRVAPDRCQPGLAWGAECVLTAEAGLPPQEGCALVRPDGTVVSGRVTRRDACSGIATIGLAAPAVVPALSPAEPARPGALAVLLGVTAAGEPTARLTGVYAAPRPDGGAAAPLVLDTGLSPETEGGPVLDAAGDLLGLAVAGSDGRACVVPYARLAALLTPGGGRAGYTGRGWLGLSLQPVTLASGFGWLGGNKGRRVMAIEPDGPAALGGIAVGDTLLAIDGRPINGQHSLREFLAGERVGRSVELRLARGDRIETCWLTIAPHPDG